MADITNNKFLDLLGLTHYNELVKDFINEKVNKSNSDLTALTTRVDSIDTSLLNVSTAVDTISSKLTDVSNAVDLNTEAIATLKDLHKDTDELLLSLVNIAAELHEHVTDNDKTFTEIDSSIIDLKGKVSTNTDDIATLKGRVDNHDTDITNINSSINSIKTTLSGLSDITDRISDLENTSDDHEGRITANENAIDELQKKKLGDLTIGGVTYNGSESKTVNIELVDLKNGTIGLKVGDTTTTTLSTEKFTKDSFLKTVDTITKEDGKQYLQFGFKLEGDTDDDAPEVIEIAVDKIFDGKATSIKLTTGVTNSFVTLEAGTTTVEAAIKALANAGNDLKSNLETSIADNSTKITKNTNDIADIKTDINSFVRITNNEIDALFGE